MMTKLPEVKWRPATKEQAAFYPGDTGPLRHEHRSAKLLGMPKPSNTDLENRFIYHPGNPERNHKHGQVSMLTLQLAKELRDLCPEGRNLSLALTHLEDVRMRANAALACDSPPEESGSAVAAPVAPVAEPSPMVQVEPMAEVPPAQ